MRLVILALLLSCLSTAQQSRPERFSDGEVEIVIPASWRRATGHYPTLEPSRDAAGAVTYGNAVLQADAKLILQKDGYTLALAYRTTHASGIIGGRFQEAFHIPWLSRDETCEGFLTAVPQPASRTMMFYNLLIDPRQPGVLAKCGIPKSLARERRWFAGFFTTAEGFWFFDENDDDLKCLSKVYSLTTSATTPNKLPVPEDHQLQRIVQEAIDIVDSIHYKRCEPKKSAPFR